MKILHVNTNDIQGGAARAAYRLHQALLKQGVDSQMLVQKKTSDDYTVIGPKTKFKRVIALLRPTIDGLPLLLYRNRTKTLFSPAWLPSNVVRKINEINPDIVHLHWICGGMLRIEDLKRIKGSIVWSCHDMWPFTGGEHIDEGQGHYLYRCGNSKVLGSKRDNDLSRRVWLRKNKTYKAMGIFSVIGLSKWMHECAKKSTLFKNKHNVCLPNPIDADIFKPFDKKKSRELWNLPLNKKLLLFGAMGATSDPNKGFKQLSEALQKLNEDLAVEFVVFGSSEPKNAPDFGFKTHYLGVLTDNVSLITLYSAVDVMIVPSLQENLSNAIMESLACATPVVGFNIGGNNNLIEHKVNGYLAKPLDTEDLKNGIEWLLNNEQYNNLCNNAREKVLKTFDSDVVVKKYIELYRSII